MKISIALVGDYQPETVVAHRAIPEALRLIAGDLSHSVEGRWIGTEALAWSPERKLESYDAIWCVPGSPYANTEGALAAIRYARTTPLPFLGTCGGFQHAIIEYAQAVWGVDAAAHAETDPDAENPVISKLSCSLVDVSDELRLLPGSKLAQVHGCGRISEEYRCNYGLNPAYADRLDRDDLKVAARDRNGEVRAIELASHPFFVATLFQPERAALKGTLPPLVKAFVQAAAERHGRAGL